jgi:phage terminase small subunit
MKELSPKQLLYVQRRVAGDNCAAAARAAGYAEPYARRAADTIEAKNPKIVEAIAAAREEIRKQTLWDADRLIRATTDTIEFARQHRNPMAAIKGLELIAKLTGQLVERVQIETPSIAAALAEARSRRVSVDGGKVQLTSIPAPAKAEPAPPVLSADLDFWN